MGNTESNCFASQSHVYYIMLLQLCLSTTFEKSLCPFTHNTDPGLEASVLRHWDTGANASPTWLSEGLLPEAEVAEKCCNSRAKVWSGCNSTCTASLRTGRETAVGENVRSLTKFHITVATPNLLGLVAVS